MNASATFRQCSAILIIGSSLALLAPTTAQATTLNVDPPLPPTPPAISDLRVQTKLAALHLPVGPVNGIIGSESLRALCSWRELTGRTATRLKPTDAERSALLATPNSKRWKVPTSLRKVRFAVNMTCQTAFFITAGTVERVIPVSTGSYPGATRRGMFRVYWIYPGRWQTSTTYPEPNGQPGLFRPIYFDGNVAVHGTPHALRTFPESHGCIRTARSDQRWIAKRLTMRMRVWVYGNYWKAAVAPYGLKPTIPPLAPAPVPAVTTTRTGRVPTPTG